MKIVNDLCPDADALVDPLCGSGSSAWAARLLALPFFGIELDPVLACAAVAKASATVQDARQLANSGSVADAVARIDQNSSIAACLAVTALLSSTTNHPTHPAMMLHDLEVSPAPRDGNTVLWADATQEPVWDELTMNPQHAVLYTSPPFGIRSPRPEAPAGLHAVATRALTAAGTARAQAGPADFPPYADIAATVIRHATRRLPRLTAVLEHEPADDGQDARQATAERLLEEFDDQIARLSILETGAYSSRGQFSLILCEIRR